MEHFVIYTNLHKDSKLTVTNRIRNYLIAHAKQCVLWDGETAEEEMKDADCMIVLGGDGTMLQAARDVQKWNLPLIGVNLGTLGYMTEIELSALEESLDLLMNGQFEVESRMMLSGKVEGRQGTEEDLALNDIVISRSGSLQIIKFNILVNGQFLNNYSAAGVIVTTPTGSTGYNLSAGGPIVEPKARLIMITPICPHTLNQRSIILSPEDVIEIEISEGREGCVQTVEANFDGNHVVPMHTGERIKISFLEVLHKKLSEN